MANIIRYGKTPQWGVYDKIDDMRNNCVILDTYNYSVEVKDYEQLDKAGRVAGYLIYDQVVNFDMSGTLLHACGQPENTELGTAWTTNGERYYNVGVYPGAPTIQNYLGGVNFALGRDSTVSLTTVIKNYSVNTSQGAAATFSLSGTIYAFSDDSSN